MKKHAGILLIMHGLLTGACSLLLPVFAAAQDINFSQFYELPLLRNPALAGTYRGDVRITTAFRNQWNSVTVPYQTEALGAELKFNQGKKATLFKLMFAPFTSFIQAYIVKRGFLDGRHGFIVAAFNAYGTFLKYAKLWQLNNEKNK